MHTSLCIDPSQSRRIKNAQLDFNILTYLPRSGTGSQLPKYFQLVFCFGLGLYRADRSYSRAPYLVDKSYIWKIINSLSQIVPSYDSGAVLCGQSDLHSYDGTLVFNPVW